MKYILRTSLVLFAIVVVSIQAMGQLSFSVDIKHASCPNTTDAEIAITITNGQTGNIIVQWENPITLKNDYVVVKGSSAIVKFPADGENNQPLSVGELIVTVVDVTNVKKIDSQTSKIEILQPKASEFSVKHPTNGLSNGEISITPIHNDDVYSYKYSIDNGENFQDSPVFINLRPIAYTLNTLITSDKTTCSLSNIVELKSEEAR